MKYSLVIASFKFPKLIVIAALTVLIIFAKLDALLIDFAVLRRQPDIV